MPRRPADLQPPQDEGPTVNLNLYLCEFTRRVHEYPDRHLEKPGNTRLVWAQTEDEAVEKLKAAEELDDPYAVSIRLDRIVTHRAIE